DAYTDLQDALASAIFGDSIWVANGTYQPSDIPPGCTGCFVNRDWTFFLKDGVRIYGGFSGTENTLNERDIPANPTILSGDIGVLGDDLDNSFHVVMAAGPAGTNIGITIDGFTIIGGNANGAGSVTINGSTCYRGAAGGVYIVKEESALNEINNNTIKSNFSILLGGGININGTKSSNKINNNLITGNSGKDGGGLRLQGGNAVNELNFNTINNNTANTAGGGLYLLGDNSTNDLNHNIISSNTANEYGGVYLKGNSGINEIIYNNINDNSSGLDWGGAYIEGENAVSTVLSENTIINNNAGRNYGGLYWDGTTASANTMNKNIIDSNSAVSNYGGLYLKIDFATTNTLTDNTLTNNSATNGSYGGAYIYSPGINNILSQNTISGNSAGSDYGGLYLVGNLAKNKFYNNTIRNNSASNDYGGVCMYGGDEDTLSHNTIIGNTAGNNYGGIFLSGSNVSNVVVNNVISGNSAVNSHGGMYFYGNFSIVPKVINNTIYGNTATNYGGLSLYNGNFTTSNNIFWGNVAAPSGSQFFANVDAYPTVNNSIIEGGWPICNNCPGTSGDGNIDPLILDITDFDGPDDLPATPDDGLSIQYYSPAINAGTITDAPSDDITGYTRDATPDIGAYENNNNQWMGTVDTNWDNPANWSMGMVPHMNQDAYISSSATHFPMIVANAYCRQLLVPDGSQITLNSGGHLQTGSHIQIGNGTSGQLTMNGGTLTAYDLILNANSTFIHNSGAINLSN
ncbi:MAG: hypothetical protein HKN68_20900, partial [Saprospiraceae bacterium]|nr:hypothetical protein [Saprospiraceae bacterium]